MVATAIIGSSVVGGLMSSGSQKGASDSASQAQMQASQMSIDEQRRQFDSLQKLLAPYVQAGTGSLGAQQNLLGLNGAGAQSDAINAIRNGSQFQALQQQGENSILQNASATGGLRGGNTQAALAQFSPQLLNQLIGEQYAKLGGMTSLGQNAAAMQGNAGMQSANAISNQFGQIGAAQAGSALAGGRADAQMFGGIAQGIGTAAGLGAFKNLFGGGGGGGVWESVGAGTGLTIPGVKF